MKTPKYIRCYDNNGESFDRFTIVFTKKRIADQFMYLGLSVNPYHPQGFSQHGFSDDIIDKPKYSHLGKKVKFEELPDDVREIVYEEYEGAWIDSKSENLYIK